MRIDYFFAVVPRHDRPFLERCLQAAVACLHRHGVEAACTRGRCRVGANGVCSTRPAGKQAVGMHFAHDCLLGLFQTIGCRRFGRVCR